jgi:LDH2 family malate/lactate/ureidoglycolate dehydrogenase
MNSKTIVQVKDLNTFVTHLFVAHRMSLEHAQDVSDALLWANLRGVDTHGVSRIHMYCEMIKKGHIDPQGNPEVIQSSLSVQVIEANQSAGPIAVKKAASLASHIAKSTGIGLVMVRNTTHTAALGYYTEMLAQQGLCALAISASRPMMAYHGAAGAGVSTAPLSMAVPARDNKAVFLDMSSGVISMGKLIQHRHQNLPLQEEWALDEKGSPTTDPQKAFIPRPLGGPKGSGLALMIELMTSLPVMNPLLSGALNAHGGEVRHNQNAWVIAIDISKFCEPEDFLSELDETITAIKALPKMDPASEILMPGERGYLERARREKNGIGIPPTVIEQLNRLAQEAGVITPW